MPKSVDFYERLMADALKPTTSETDKVHIFQGVLLREYIGNSWLSRVITQTFYAKKHLATARGLVPPASTATSFSDLLAPIAHEDIEFNKNGDFVRIMAAGIRVFGDTFRDALPGNIKSFAIRAASTPVYETVGDLYGRRYQREKTPGKHKFVIVGSEGVGKSCLVARLVRDQFISDQEGTIGAAFLAYSSVINSETHKLEIWDTAGQTRYRALAPMYYQGAEYACVVFDITNHDSFKAAKGWVAELQRRGDPELKILFVGNKLDLVQGEPPTATRAVRLDEVNDYLKGQKGMIPFYTETSAKDDDNNAQIYNFAENKTIASSVQDLFMYHMLKPTAKPPASRTLKDWLMNYDSPAALTAASTAAVAVGIPGAGTGAFAIHDIGSGGGGGSTTHTRCTGETPEAK